MFGFLKALFRCDYKVTSDLAMYQGAMAHVPESKWVIITMRLGQVCVKLVTSKKVYKVTARTELEGRLKCLAQYMEDGKRDIHE